MENTKINLHQHQSAPTESTVDYVIRRTGAAL